MKAPKLRFKGYTGDWEQRKLGDIVSFSKGTGYSKSDLQDSGIPIILYGRMYTKYETVISEVDTFADEKPNSVFSKGGEVIVPASGETAEDISVASVVDQSGVMLGGDLNIITPPQDLDSAFLAISISNGKPHRDMAKMAQGKSIVHLHNSDLAKINLPYPSYEEQSRISKHFKSLDSLITLHQCKCEALKELKKGMLQKMFPKEGAKVPEFRFKGFTGDWEQRKLGSIICDYNEKNPVDEDLPILTSSRQGIQKQEEHFGSEQRHDTTDYNVIPRGYCTYRNRSDDRTFTFNVNDCVERGIVSKFYPVFSIDNGNAKFVTEYLNSNYEIKNKLAVLSVGTSQVVLSLNNLKSLDIQIPSKDEQEKIGDYLNRFDNLITLHHRKCDELKKMKKGLLQKMFI